MIVTSARYLRDGSILAVIDGREWVVPEDTGNRMRQAIAAWGTPDPWIEPPPPVPQSVSRFQARAAMHVAGLLDQVEAAIAQADTLAQMAWTDAVEFRRDSPTIAALAAQIGLTDAEIDALFRAAAEIEA